jgi:nucleoid DNA-binding protein
MIPKKYNTIVKTISENLDIDELEVYDIVNFFYKELRTNLSDLSDLKINVPGLGYFLIRKNKVDESITKCKRKLNVVDTSSFSGYHYKKTTEEKLEKLEAIKIKIDKFLEEKENWKNAKNTGSLEK